jgi:hypothetical protein
MRLHDLEEAFTDLGKLSGDELKKGQRLSPTENNFTQVDGRVFFTAVSSIMSNDIARGDQARGLDTLTVYPINDYNQMKCFLGKNNSSGYAIKDGNELVSVFSSQGSSGNAIVADANNNGASRLDCFAERAKDGKISGQLYLLYTRHGYHVDTTMNSGTPGEAYSTVNGVSSFVDDNGNVYPEDPRVVIFMKL